MVSFFHLIGNFDYVKNLSLQYIRRALHYEKLYGRMKPLKRRPTMTSCDFCAYNEYDEADECYYCSVNMDEDDMVRFIQSSYRNCPYYKSGDEYQIVRHQM